VRARTMQNLLHHFPPQAAGAAPVTDNSRLLCPPRLTSQHRQKFCCRAMSRLAAGKPLRFRGSGQLRSCSMLENKLADIVSWTSLPESPQQFSYRPHASLPLCLTSPAIKRGLHHQLNSLGYCFFQLKNNPTTYHKTPASTPKHQII